MVVVVGPVPGDGEHEEGAFGLVFYVGDHGGFAERIFPHQLRFRAWIGRKDEKNE